MLGSASRRRLFVAAALFLVTAASLAASAAPARSFIPTLEPVWSRSFDGGTNLTDRATDIAVAGTIVWASGVWREGTSGQDMALVRVPTAGARARAFTWKGPRGRDAALALATARDGSVYTAGYSGGPTRADLCLVKWSSLGRVLWSKRYDGPLHGDDSAVDVAVDRWGNVTVCGSVATRLGPRWQVVSYSPAGMVRWTHRRSDRLGYSSEAKALCVDGLGSVYVTGWRTDSGGQADAITAKYTKAGTVTWSRLMEGEDGRSASTRCIARCPSGGVYVGGSIYRMATHDDPLLVRYTSAGDPTVFSNGTDLTEKGVIHTLAVASDGSVITGGYQNYDVADNPQAVLYSAAGTPLSTWSWTDTECGWSAGIFAAGADTSGHVYWAGYQMPMGGDMRAIIGCRSVTAGGGDWIGAWSSGGSWVTATDCVVSGTALYVAGGHYKGAQASNLFVLKYAP